MPERESYKRECSMLGCILWGKNQVSNSEMRTSLDVPRTLNRTGDLAFSVAASRLWSTLNQDLLNAKTLYNFKTRLRNYAILKT